MNRPILIIEDNAQNLYLLRYLDPDTFVDLLRRHVRG